MHNATNIDKSLVSTFFCSEIKASCFKRLYRLHKTFNNGATADTRVFTCFSFGF